MLVLFWLYDNTGKRIYQRNCVEYVVDIAFHKDNDGLCFTSVQVENGVMNSTITSVLFHQVDIPVDFHAAGDNERKIRFFFE